MTRTPQWLVWSCLLIVVSRALPLSGANTPSRVQIESADGGYRLLRNGAPYFVKGAGGSTQLKQLVTAGGNSIRTWTTDGQQDLLDRAHGLGLTVTLGFWLGHERHGFRYDDAKAVWQQREKAREAVLAYKDHPALLAWCVGNEMEGAGENPAIWYAVNDVARMMKELDPNHPTMVVIAELGRSKVRNIHRFCPDIDIVGINSYGGLQSLAKRYAEQGGTKPFMATEFGPVGQWETGKAEWGAPHEMTSTEKAAFALEGYRKSILNQPLCLGSYVFVWGHKQEATATWFGMFLPDGSRLAMVEAMTDVWGGTLPAGRCPVLDRVSLDRMKGLKPGDTIKADVVTSDPDGDPIEVEWVLRRESGMYNTGGDAQAAMPDFPDAVKPTGDRTAQVTIPESGGAYRVFAYIRDGKGNAAVANVPIHVEGEVLAPKLKAVDVPFYVYREAHNPAPYAPSGYMGNTGAITMEMACKEQPFAGEYCLKVTYGAADQWGGVVWQSPPDDWGERPGGFDLTRASHLEFWAKGETGAEVVTFGFGLLDAKAKYPDSAKSELKNVQLGTDWKRFRIPLAGKDLSRIKTGFYWTLAANGRPVTFCLDDVRFAAD